MTVQTVSHFRLVFLYFGLMHSTMQVQHFMQDTLIALIASNPTRTSPWAEAVEEHLRHLPTENFVRHFLKRKGLVYRRSMPLSLRRAMQDPEDLAEWSRLTEEALFSDPDLAEAMRDPARVFNMDEKPLTAGTDHPRVLAPRGYRGPIQTKSGDSRIHVTGAFTVSADGLYVGVRLVYKGLRSRVKQTSDIPESGVAGKWQVSVTPNGYVTCEAFKDVVRDLDRHLTDKQIQRPVILFVDGFAGHLSPEISELCRELDIRLRLFR